MKNLVLQFKCCGVNGPNDWEKAGYTPKSDLPRSCCFELPRDKPKCDINDITTDFAGCKKKLQKAIEDNGAFLGATGLIIALVQVFYLYNYLFLKNRS